MGITKIQLNLESLHCTSTSIGPGGDELQFVSELWNTSIPGHDVLLQPRQSTDLGTLTAGKTIGPKLLWTYDIPASWINGTAPWPDTMELRVWINKIESFLQQIPAPPAPPAPPGPAPQPLQVGLGPINLTVPFSFLQAVGSAIVNLPHNVMHLILESTLASYKDAVDGAGIHRMWAQGGDIFDHAFKDNTAGKKKFGAYGSDFTIEYKLVAA